MLVPRNIFRLAALADPSATRYALGGVQFARDPQSRDRRDPAAEAAAEAAAEPQCLGATGRRRVRLTC